MGNTRIGIGGWTYEPWRGVFYPEGLAALRAEDRIAFTYAPGINGSVSDIAGVLSANRRVLGMMPHPERAADAALGGRDGAALFASLVNGFVTV